MQPGTCPIGTTIKPRTNPRERSLGHSDRMVLEDFETGSLAWTLRWIVKKANARGLTHGLLIQNLVRE